MILYMETSAFLKLVKEEPESSALRTRFETLRRGADHVVSSQLLTTEAHRAAQRIAALEPLNVSRALRQVELFDLSSDVLRLAGLLPGEHLRSLDAIHIAAALDIRADAVITYDHRVQQGAASQGMVTEYP